MLTESLYRLRSEGGGRCTGGVRGHSVVRPVGSAGRRGQWGGGDLDCRASLAGMARSRFGGHMEVPQSS